MPNEPYKFIVCYDIANSRVRSRLAERLKDFGVRVQFSVFELTVSLKRFDELLAALDRFEIDEGDSIAVYPVDSSFKSGVIRYGAVFDDGMDDVYII